MWSRVAVSEEPLAERGVLAQRCRVGWPGLGAVDAPVRAIHVGAAHQDGATGDAGESRDRQRRVLFAHRPHVDDDVRAESAERVAEGGQLAAVAVDVAGLAGEVGLVLAAMKEEHLAARGQELSDDLRTQKDRPTEHYGAHRSGEGTRFAHSPQTDAAMRPKRDRPDLPDGYIKRTPRGMLTWSDAEKILDVGRYFWLGTTNPDGGPHVVQQWGVWVDGCVWFEGSDRTRWARNLARDPRLAFGTQVADRAVYGRATVELVRGVDEALAATIAKRYGAKYGRSFGYRPKPEQYAKGYVFRARPTKIIAFDVKRFETSAARFTLPA